MRNAVFAQRSPIILPAARKQVLPSNHRPPLLYRQPADIPHDLVPVESARDEQTAMLEAVLFLADEPLPARKLARAVGLADAAEIRQTVEKLQRLYDSEGNSFQVVEIAGGYQLLTRPEFHRWLTRLRVGQELRLSAAARETLAVIAYRQPIVRADIEAIRGVQCGELLRMLVEKGLIRIAGRDHSLGRPVLYGTTKKFLEVLGLKNLNELPDIAETLD